MFRHVLDRFPVVSQTPSLATREAGTSQPAGRSIRRRPSVSHVLVGVAVVMAFVLNILAFQSRDASVMVAVAEGEIGAGTVLTPAMVKMVPIDAGFEGLASLVDESVIASRYGWIVQRPIAAGGVIDRMNLADPVTTSGLRAMSIPVPVSRAAGGTMVVGDSIDLIVVRDGVPEYVVSGVEVLAVAGGGAGFASVDHHLVVAVDADQALAIAAALAGGTVDVIRSTGAPEVVVEETPDEP